QVDLLQVGSGVHKGNLFGISYPTAGSVNGIQLGLERNWDPGTFIRIIESFFPAHTFPDDELAWNSLDAGYVPPPNDPEEPEQPGEPGGGDEPGEPGGGDEPENPELPPIAGDWPEQPFHSISAAKALAYANNRPLLVVLGSAICPHCDNFDNRVFNTDAFLAYAAAKRIVLYHQRDDGSLRRQVMRDYQREAGMETVLPVIFMFKVRAGADLTSDDSTALIPTQVDILQVGSGVHKGNLFGISYPTAGSVNGIQLGLERDWDPGTFIRIIESFFPARTFPDDELAWNSIIPPPLGPSGYENAYQFGRVPDQEQQPDDLERGWMLYAPNDALSGSSASKWFRFAGRAGQRYLLSGRDFASNTAAAIVKLEFYASSASKPLDPPVLIRECQGWDFLDRGLFLDTPDAPNPEQEYFIRLSHSGGNADTLLSFGLKLHQTSKNPDLGDVTNPHWSSAALPGQWTMNRASAEEAASLDGKPVIYYFTGLYWCPYCVAMEQILFASADFNQALSNAYLVVVDNRRRNDEGPALLRDNSDNGYLQRNNIDEDAAETKLQDNLDLQNQLALPGASTVGWDHGPRIGYPTLVYCRMTNTKAIEPVGRIGLITDTILAIAKVQELDWLAGQGYRESNAYHERSTQELANISNDPNNPAVLNSAIGGLAETEWYKFSIAEGKCLVVTASSATAQPDAEVELSVYTENAQTLLQRREDSLQNGAALEFIPAAGPAQNYWLRVQAFDQQSAVPYTLTYYQEDLTYEISALENELYLSKSAEQFSLHLRLLNLWPNGQPIKMRYRIVPQETTAFYYAEGEKKYTDWQEYNWIDGAEEAELIFPLHVPAADTWEGARNFGIELEAVENCRIAQDSKLIQGRLYAKACFAPRPVQTELQLYTNVAFNLDIPICRGGVGYVFSRSGILPPGLAINHDPVAHKVTVSGLPTEAANLRIIGLQLKENGQVCDELVLKISVQVMPSGLGQAYAYAGYLLDAELSNNAPVGSFSMQRQENGSFVVKLNSLDTVEELQINVDGWNAYDPVQKILLLNVETEEGHILQLQLTEDGEGSGSFTSTKGRQQQVFFRAVHASPLEYDGYYTVALRPPQSTGDADNFAYGWLLFEVDEQGKVTYSGELCDGATFTGETFLYEHNNKCKLVFFAPFDYDLNHKCHLGWLSGILDIVPKSERTNPYDAYVSDCEGSSIWQKSNSDPVVLSPCGSVYKQDVSLSEQCGLQDGLFQLQTKAPDGVNAMAPNLLLLQEQGDEQGDHWLSPNNAGIMAGLLGDIALQQDGCFTAQIKLLLPEQNSISEALDLRGVLTPVTSDCCSEGSDLYAAYGYYRYGEKTYFVRLATTPNSEIRPEKPELLSLSGQQQDFQFVFAADIVEAEVSSPSKYLLYHKVGSDEYMLRETVQNEPSFILDLDNGVTWNFTALSASCLESEVLEFTLHKAEQNLLLALPSEENPEGSLQPGWNLIGIPCDFMPAVDAALPNIPIMALAEEASSYVQAKQWRSAEAYWIFVEADFAGMELPGMQIEAAEHGLHPGWNLTSCSEFAPEGAATTLWIWQDGEYKALKGNFERGQAAWKFQE
ncbi:MAG: hypothetical protein GX946_04940, partial [Oligosphaeraceae bacterium]|nr:hypothetical protein [Oligosphaeraceae bacterium]